SALYLAKLALNLTSDFRGFPRTSYWVLPPSSRPGNPETTDGVGPTESDPSPVVPGIPVPGVPKPKTTDTEPPVVPPLETRGTGTSGTTDRGGPTASDPSPVVPEIPVSGVPKPGTTETESPVVPPLGTRRTRTSVTTGGTHDLPGCLIDLRHFDNSDPIGSHDEEPDDVGTV